MKKNLGGALMSAIALFTAILGFLLRRAELNGGSAVGLIVVSVLVLGGAIALSLTLKRRKKYEDVFSPCMADLLLSALGSILLLAGCAVMAIGGSGLERIIGVLGMVSSLALMRALMLRCGKKPVHVLYYVPLVLFYVLRLFYDFRRWSVDPIILDYCFSMLALICFMLASYYVGTYCFDRGSRRLMVVFSMLGVYFGGIALASGGWQTVLTYLGSMLLMLCNVWQGSKPKLKKRQPVFKRDPANEEDR